MIDAGFGGSFERERYFREIINAIIAYENETPALVLQSRTVGISA